MNEKINKIIEALQEVQREINTTKATPTEDKSNYVRLSPTMFSKIINVIANVENQGIVEKGFLNEVLKEVQYPVEETENVNEDNSHNKSSSDNSNKAKGSDKKNKRNNLKEELKKLTDEDLERLAYELFINPLLHHSTPRL